MNQMTNACDPPPSCCWRTGSASPVWSHKRLAPFSSTAWAREKIPGPFEWHLVYLWFHHVCVCVGVSGRQARDKCPHAMLNLLRGRWEEVGGLAMAACQYVTFWYSDDSDLMLYLIPIKHIMAGWWFMEKRDGGEIKGVINLCLKFHA